MQANHGEQEGTQKQIKQHWVSIEIFIDTDRQAKGNPGGLLSKKSVISFTSARVSCPDHGAHSRVTGMTKKQ